MSYYYKQAFTSPQQIYAIVKEELKSYFDTGAVDDTMFPIWTNKCLLKLGKSSYPINQSILQICDYKAQLPEDFYATREAWMCVAWEKDYQLPSATYEQKVKDIATRIDNRDVYCSPCNECEYPAIIEAIYKVTNTVLLQFKKEYLLTPGNIYPACPDDLYCANFNAAAPNSYDVRDNKFVTTFRSGTVYLQYYSLQLDESNDQLIPDEFRTKEYIELFLKQKIFEQLSNQVTDETFNQIEMKAQKYKAMADEAYILADTENKKEDVYRKQRAIRRTLNRNRPFEIR